MNDFDFLSPSTNQHNQGVINWKVIFRVLAILLFIEAGLLLTCIGISWAYGEKETIYFFYTILINTGVGGILYMIGKNADPTLTRRDAYCIVSFAWILFTLFGMLPFWLSGKIPSVTDAFFETMSGFTTTGASVLNNIESLPHSMLFWRSLIQWIGGLGIVFFTIALLPFASGGSSNLYFAEATGVKHDKIKPKINVMAKWIWMVYIILTVAETILLMFGGMNLFDAVCHAFTTTATGGFSTKQNSISYWKSPYIEYVVSIFMILSGVNFSLYFLCLKGHAKRLFKDDEFHWFLKSVITLTLIITVALVFYNHYDIEKAFRKALFQVATAHTSCGFITDDYNLWPPFTWLLLIYAMISGGCTGSTSGGLKDMRVMIVAQCIKNQFKRALHPKAVLPVRVNNEPIDPSTVTAVHTFVIFYLLCVFVGWLLLMAFGVGLPESLCTVVSSIGNVGPGLGAFGPIYSWAALPDAAKWVLSFLMFIGRLELYGVLLLFSRVFWTNN
ncbi:MAG: TrkH family potassium uptake protein [Parabacteroides sp.]|nr:TrkH family potassium uptake protein [Parabacteroides sp.]